jgi:hypothetical protein
MAELYPDAKFILSLRSKEDDWLESMKRHTRNRKWAGHRVVYGAKKAKDHEALYLEAYRNHTDSVRAFFAAPEMQGRLLEMVMDEPEKEEGEKWRRLCDFLGLEVGSTEELNLKEFPLSNSCHILQHGDRSQLSPVLDRLSHKLVAGLVKFLEGLGWITAAAA